MIPRQQGLSPAIAEDPGPSIYDVFSISCIFRRVQRETTADCSAITTIGGLKLVVTVEFETDLKAICLLAASAEPLPLKI
jgi:hypothetical protein